MEKGRSPVMVDRQRIIAQEGNYAFEKYSKWLFWATTSVLGTLLASGVLILGTIAPGDARIKTLYILSVVAAVVGTLIGALLNLRKVRVLFYGQAVALIALIGCLMTLTGILVFGGQPPAFVDDVPDPDATASSHVDKHTDARGRVFTYEPERAIDGAANTAWRVEGDGEGQWIQLDYIRPIKVSAIGIIPGHDKIDPVSYEDRFQQLHVVRRVSIVFSDGTVVPAEFERDRSIQFTRLDSPETTEWVRIEIQDSYPLPSDNVGPIDETAISEIEVQS
jgi:hypothetical protein